MTTPSKKWQLKQLRPLYAEAREGTGLRDTRITWIGCPDAKVLVLGDAPDYYDEEAGKPFSGKAGEVLKSVLFQAGLKKKQVYATNVLKFRPECTDVMGIENKSPSMRDLKAFRPALLREIAIVRPEIILVLGGHAAKLLTGDPDFKITHNRGNYLTCSGVACEVLATYHPAYVWKMGGDRATIYADFVSDIKEVARVYEN